MKCMEKYRSGLVSSLNRDLRMVLAGADEFAIHDFRVGIKRLGALYYFLESINPDLALIKSLKPYRKIFKVIGLIREKQIAIKLISGLAGVEPVDGKKITRVLRAGIRRDYRAFLRIAETFPSRGMRLPTIKSTGITARALSAQKYPVLQQLVTEVLQGEDIVTAKQWHRKRILLKRYHHIIDAFQFCPGHALDEKELKQIRMLEQLLGDWHDRVVTADLLLSIPELEAPREAVIAIMKNQDRLLLGAAKIYLHKYGLWHARTHN